MRNSVLTLKRQRDRALPRQAVRKKLKRKRIGGGRGPSGNVIKSRAKGKANKANTEQKVISSGLARLARLGPNENCTGLAQIASFGPEVD